MTPEERIQMLLKDGKCHPTHASAIRAVFDNLRAQLEQMNHTPTYNEALKELGTLKRCATERDELKLENRTLKAQLERMECGHLKAEMKSTCPSVSDDCTNLLHPEL